MFAVRRHCDCLFAVAFFVSAACTFAQDSLNVRKIGEVNDYWGDAVGVVVVDTIAYVATGSTGLRVVNVGDPSLPTEVGVYRGAWIGDVLAASANRVYFSANQTLLRFLDVSDPTAPVETGEFETASPIAALQCDGNRVYILTTAGLVIIDTSIPAFPSVIGVWQQTLHSEHFHVQGYYVYIADQDFGLRIVDITEPTNPIPAGELELWAGAVDIAAVGNVAYVVDGWNGVGMWLVDVANPYSPAIVREPMGPSPLYSRVEIDGQFACAYSMRGYIRVYDATMPDQPVRVGDVTVRRFRDFSLASGFACVASGPSGLRSIALAGHEEPAEMGSFDTGSALSIALQGEYAYIANDDHGLRLVDIADPQHPVVLSDTETGYRAVDVAVQGSYAYIADYWAALHIIDVSDPFHPHEVGVLDSLDSFVSAVAVSENRVFLATYTDGLVVIDVSNPDSLFVSAQVEDLYYAYDVAVSGNYALVAGSPTGDNGLVVVDIANPDEPRLTGQVALEFTGYAVAARGRVAYVGGGNGFAVVDFAEATNPQVLSSMMTDNGVYGVSVEGDYLYLAQWNEGLRVFDVTNPAAPVETGHYWTWNRSRGVAVRDGIAYLADYSNFGIYDCSAALGMSPSMPRVSSFSLSPAYPNPFNSITHFELDLPRAVTGRVTVFDLLGREVLTLFDGQLHAGRRKFAFDAAGLASGEYFVRVDAPPMQQTVKVVLVK